MGNRAKKKAPQKLCSAFEVQFKSVITDSGGIRGWHLPLQAIS